MAGSEEVGLLHDAEELLLVHFTVSISISLIDHFLQFLVGHMLTQLLCHSLQILEGDLAGLVVVEQAEDLVCKRRIWILYES